MPRTRLRDGAVMTEFLWFLVGLFIGGIVMTLTLCYLQINRINKYEVELRKLRSQLNNR